MSKRVSAKDFRLDSDFDIDGDQLTAVVDMDDEDDGGEVPAIGYTMIYTIGEMVIPRDWLMGRMEDLGLPVWCPGMEGEKEYMLPPKVTPKRAFTRTRKYLMDSVNDHQTIDGRLVEFETRKGDTNTFHLLANAFFEGEIEGIDDDGEWRQVTIGVCRYNREHGAMAVEAKVDENDPLHAPWLNFKDAALEMFMEMQESHIGKDIQKMMFKYVNHWTDSVKFREGGAVYFVPAKHEASLAALKTLVTDINEGENEEGEKFKDTGNNCEIQRIPVVNNGEMRQAVEDRACAHVEDQVSSALPAAFESYENQLENNEEVLIDGIVEVLEEQLVETDDFATEYNALLDAELDVREAVEGWMEGRRLGEAKQNIVEEALQKVE